LLTNIKKYDFVLVQFNQLRIPKLNDGGWMVTKNFYYSLVKIN